MKSLLVIFPNVDLKHNKIGNLKKILNDCLDRQEDLLHNHTPDGGFNYRYPLVQYRSHEGKAALFGIGASFDFIQKLLASSYLPARFSANYQVLKAETEIRMTSTNLSYHLSHFIPFDNENYVKWKAMETLGERSDFLQQNIANHILNFCRNVEFEIPKKSLEVVLRKMTILREAKIKNSKVLCFNAVFKTNILLPDHLGLGRYKSMGYGIMSPILEVNHRAAAKLGSVEKA
jgi:Cas6b C-terminal domain